MAHVGGSWLKKDAKTQRTHRPKKAKVRARMVDDATWRDRHDEYVEIVIDEDVQKRRYALSLADADLAAILPLLMQFASASCQAQSTLGFLAGLEDGALLAFLTDLLSERRGRALKSAVPNGQGPSP